MNRSANCPLEPKAVQTLLPVELAGTQYLFQSNSAQELSALELSAQARSVLQSDWSQPTGRLINRALLHPGGQNPEPSDQGRRQTVEQEPSNPAFAERRLPVQYQEA